MNSSVSMGGTPEIVALNRFQLNSLRSMELRCEWARVVKERRRKAMNVLAIVTVCTRSLDYIFVFKSSDS
jgi:hypothetical protein